MTGRNIILIILFLALLGGVYKVFIAGKGQTTSPQMPEVRKNVGEPVKQATENNVKTFIVSGKPFEFDPKEIRVKQGDMVRIEFKNTLGFHNLTVEGYNVQTKQIQAGQEDTIEFTADKTGTFEYFCNVGTHREMGMVGKLIVE